MRGRTTYPKKETREDADEVAACSRADAVVPLFLAGTDPMRVLRARLDCEDYAGGGAA